MERWNRGNKRSKWNRGEEWNSGRMEYWNNGIVSRKSSRYAGLDFRGSSKNYKNRRFFIFREKNVE